MSSAAYTGNNIRHDDAPVRRPLLKVSLCATQLWNVIKRGDPIAKTAETFWRMMKINEA